MDDKNLLGSISGEFGEFPNPWYGVCRGILNQYLAAA